VNEKNDASSVTNNNVGCGNAKNSLDMNDRQERACTLRIQ